MQMPNTGTFTIDGVTISHDRFEYEGYRYAYNGMEVDNEVSGNGNSYTTEFRQYDPRLGRWKSLDPVFDPSSSPFNGMDNNPILYNDKKGLYTERRANRMAARARDNGYDATVTQSGDGKRDYAINYHKRNESNTGSYTLTADKGKFRGIGAKGYTPDEKIQMGIEPSQAGAPKLWPYATMTVIEGGAAAGESLAWGVLRTLGTTVAAVFTPHGGFNPESQLDPRSWPEMDADDDRDPDDYLILYRGIGESESFAYTMAKVGVAVPQGIFNPSKVHYDPESHTAGDNNTYFTSWTTDEETAVRFSKGTSGNKNGVVLTIHVKKSEAIRSNLSQYLMDEYEYLLWGIRSAHGIRFTTPSSTRSISLDELLNNYPSP